jgi:hypothetical protein
MADNKRIIYTIEVNDQGKIKVDGLTAGFVNASGAVKKLNTDLLQQGEIMEDNAKKNQNMIDKTGLAGATVVEFGRTISDSNYGLRGMANNISQLSTLFITLITTSGGLARGLGELMKVMMGPVGLIVLFQIVIALFERADMMASKLEKTSNALADAQAKAGSELKMLRQAIDDGIFSQEQLETVIGRVNEEYDDLNLQVGNNAKLTDKSALAIDNKILSLEKLAIANAINTRAEELYAKQLDIDLRKEEALEEARIKQSADRVIRITSTGKVIERSEEDAEQRRQDRINSVEDEFNKEQVKLDEEFATLRKVANQNDYYTETFVNNSKTRTKSTKDEEKERLKFITDVEDSLAVFEEQKFLLKRKRLENHYEKLIEQTKKNGEGTIGLELAKFAALKQIDDERRLQIEQQQEKKDADAEREVLREIRINKAKNKAKDDQLRYEQEIELARVGFARQISGIFAAIGKEGSGLAKAALLLEKGAAIADIIIKSQQSIATQKAAAAAYTLQTRAAFAAGGPLGVGIAEGLIRRNQVSLLKNVSQTKIGAGLSIAKIVATSLSNKGGSVAASVPSAAEPSAPQIQAPAFNVVGATQESQLAQTISQAEQQPIKAFVVASDVSTAQELERSTIEGASIG